MSEEIKKLIDHCNILIKFIQDLEYETPEQMDEAVNITADAGAYIYSLKKD